LPHPVYHKMLMHARHCKIFRIKLQASVTAVKHSMETKLTFYYVHYR